MGLWDKFRIEQVLTNLIINVSKYAAEAPLAIELTQKDNHAVVTVRDQGPGIPPEKLKTIFERFERAVDSTAVTGLGLGLYISREIIELHHGKISVESELGKGSTFSFILPLI